MWLYTMSCIIELWYLWYYEEKVIFLAPSMMNKLHRNVYLSLRPPFISYGAALRPAVLEVPIVTWISNCVCVRVCVRVHVTRMKTWDRFCVIISTFNNYSEAQIQFTGLASSICGPTSDFLFQNARTTADNSTNTAGPHWNEHTHTAFFSPLVNPHVTSIGAVWFLSPCVHPGNLQNYSCGTLLNILFTSQKPLDIFCVICFLHIQLLQSNSVTSKQKHL